MTLLGPSWTALGEAYRQMGELKAAEGYMEQGLKTLRDAELEWLCHAFLGFRNGVLRFR